MRFLNIAAIVNATHAEGPGLRTAIWVQGCLKRCKGCCNPHFLEIKPALIVSVDTLCSLLETNKVEYGIEGITLLGGEPFLQAQGLGELAKFAQSINLSVMTFTGYLLEDLSDEYCLGSSSLLQYSDLLIDGEYMSNRQEETRNWVGSTNQVFHYFSSYYGANIETQQQEITNEWRIGYDSNIVMNGFPI
jgi:anaerobic ribonucleoside-triphosphate reductase activating protein